MQQLDVSSKQAPRTGKAAGGAQVSPWAVAANERTPEAPKPDDGPCTRRPNRERPARAQSIGRPRSLLQ
jgi:hypothetical protein